MTAPLTTNDRTDKEKYECFNADECSSSWTYDDWHCSGCHWKGLGIQEIKYGGIKLAAKADEIRGIILLKKLQKPCK
jgi:hypothetical protein